MAKAHLHLTIDEGLKERIKEIHPNLSHLVGRLLVEYEYAYIHGMSGRVLYEATAMAVERESDEAC